MYVGHVSNPCTTSRTRSRAFSFASDGLFATECADAKGKVRRTGRREDVKTPLAKLKSLPDAASFHKDGVTSDALDRAAS